MPHEESQRSQLSKAAASYYQERLKQAQEDKVRDDSLKKVVKAEEMPWENSPQGRIKHVMNETTGARVKTVDAFILELPPGGRSGKHRHFAEECFFVLEGRGYDLHWDVDVELKDKYYRKAQDKSQRFDWEEGDCVYIPVNTVHQHFNADAGKPARIICATNRAYRLVGYGDIEQLENAPDYKP
ncbi:MAG: cupin domain-containing protein [Chloroflexi bacterium]|nr:cupin domain-containing protein [Chloroflexota bacterium]